LHFGHILFKWSSRPTAKPSVRIIDFSSFPFFAGELYISFR